MATSPLADLFSSQDDADWRDYALCAEVDPELWYPEGSNKGDIAKRICADCPVRLACLEFAIQNDEQHGIWGGVPEEYLKRVRYRHRLGESIESLLANPEAEAPGTDFEHALIDALEGKGLPWDRVLREQVLLAAVAVLTRAGWSGRKIGELLGVASTTVNDRRRALLEAARAAKSHKSHQTNTEDVGQTPVSGGAAA